MFTFEIKYFIKRIYDFDLLFYDNSAQIYCFIYSWIAPVIYFYLFIVFSSFSKFCGLKRMLNSTSNVI